MSFSHKFDNSLVNVTTIRTADESQSLLDQQKYHYTTNSSITKYQVLQSSNDYPQSPFKSLKEVNPYIIDDMQGYAIPKSSSKDMIVDDYSSNFGSQRSPQEQCQQHTPENIRMSKQSGTDSSKKSISIMQNENLSPFVIEDQLFKRISRRNDNRKSKQLHAGYFEDQQEEQRGVSDFTEVLTMPFETTVQTNFENHFLKEKQKSITRDDVCAIDQVFDVPIIDDFELLDTIEPKISMFGIPTVITEVEEHDTSKDPYNSRKLQDKFCPGFVTDEFTSTFLHAGNFEADNYDSSQTYQRPQTVSMLNYNSVNTVFSTESCFSMTPKLERNLLKYFGEGKWQQKQKIIKLDGILEESYQQILETSFTQQEYMGNLDRFIDDILQGREQNISMTDLKHFQTIIPSEAQIQKFIQRTGGNFEGIIINKAIYFVVQIIQNKAVIEKSQILNQIKQLNCEYLNNKELVKNWMNLVQKLTQNQRDPTCPASTLQNVLNLAMQISNVVNSNQTGEKFDIGSILSFFDIKSEVPEQNSILYDGSFPSNLTKQDFVLYDLLLKQMVSQLASSESQISQDGRDLKMQKAQELQSIFDKSELDLLKLCKDVDLKELQSKSYQFVGDCNQILDVTNNKYENDQFQELVTKFSERVENQYKPEFDQLLQQILWIEMQIREYFCVDGEETIQEFSHILVELNQKHELRMQRYIKKRVIKQHSKAVAASILQGSALEQQVQKDVPSQAKPQKKKKTLRMSQKNVHYKLLR